MTASAVEAKVANVVYHDWEAGTYDAKWSISFDQRCIDYARHTFDHVAPSNLVVEDAVEIGAGTGFFLLNLMQSGVARRGVVTDISSGMVRTAVRQGTDLGLDVSGVVADAESLPLADASCDLVVGHAVLHHIPDVEAAVRPGALGFGWANFAYRTWQRLAWVDERVLAHVVPAELYYNVSVTGTAP